MLPSRNGCQYHQIEKSFDGEGLNHDNSTQTPRNERSDIGSVAQEASVERIILITDNPLFHHAKGGFTIYETPFYV